MTNHLALYLTNYLIRCMWFSSILKRLSWSVKKNIDLHISRGVSNQKSFLLKDRLCRNAADSGNV